MKNLICILGLVLSICCMGGTSVGQDVQRLMQECPGLTLDDAMALLEKTDFSEVDTFFRPDDGSSIVRCRVDDTTSFVLFAEGMQGVDGTGQERNDAVVVRCELVSFEQCCSKLFSEDDCHMLRLIHATPVPSGRKFNPFNLLASANALQQLGEEDAVRLLRLYCESFTQEEREIHGINPDRCLSLLRILLVPCVAGTTLPPIGFGLPFPFGLYFDNDLQWKRLMQEFPLFPLVLVDDVPFTLVEGYLVAGCCPPTMEDYLSACQGICVWRMKPLVPTTDVRTAYDNFLRSPEWNALFGDDERLQKDILSLLERQVEMASKRN